MATLNDFRLIDKISHKLNFPYSREKVDALLSIPQQGYSYIIQKYPQTGVDLCLWYAKRKIHSWIDSFQVINVDLVLKKGGY